MLTISAENVRLGSFTILDVNGVVVYTFDFAQYDSNVTSASSVQAAQSDIGIDVSDLQPGAYVIQFEELAKSLKFIKM